ncbi:hypothetical protein [Candidatus Laterigemmans baculatus]|uniref:hypothetical protein n=1 Tax=Candidatus Laterigemmans baculatus TaxID=2770505 RepID=UPI0013DC5BDA|nr:hypothetical protein [Candidatus Laterigemmans baculatus]
MSTVPDAVDDAPGQLLRELERRQDDVLAQLDRLNEQVEAVLEKLGVRLDGAPEPVAEPSTDGEEVELAEAA